MQDRKKRPAKAGRWVILDFPPLTCPRSRAWCWCCRYLIVSFHGLRVNRDAFQPSSVMKTLFVFSVISFSILIGAGCQSGPAPTENSAVPELPKGQVQRSVHDRPGFVGAEKDGAVWIFRAGSEELAKFDETQKVPGDGAAAIGVLDKPLKAPDSETLEAYVGTIQYSRPGFLAVGVDGRIWVFRSGSEALANYLNMQKVPGDGAAAIGVLDKTVKAPDSATVDAYLAEYLYSRPGFQAVAKDGRIWVFRSGSEELAKFNETQKVPGDGAAAIGVLDKTVKAPDSATIDAYLAEHLYSRPGFQAVAKDGRIWVFHSGSEELAKFHETQKVPGDGAAAIGVLAKTLKSPDSITIEDYLAVYWDRPGFDATEVEGRVWVFRSGSEELHKFRQTSKVPGDGAAAIGVIDRTLKAPDNQTIADYLSVY